MDKMWAGRFEKASDKLADDFNSSIHFDRKMYRQDIRGSIEHAAMLCRVGILTPDELGSITSGLASILKDLESGELDFTKITSGFDVGQNFFEVADTGGEGLHFSQTFMYLLKPFADKFE